MNKVATLLKSIAQESESLRLLKDAPESFAEKFKLNPEELQALRSSDLLLVARPPGASTLTFTTAHTTTARAGRSQS